MYPFGHNVSEMSSTGITRGALSLLVEKKLAKVFAIGREIVLVLRCNSSLEGIAIIIVQPCST